MKSNKDGEGLTFIVMIIVLILLSIPYIIWGEHVQIDRETLQGTLEEACASLK